MCADIEWAEIVVSVKKCYADAVANFLIEQGSTGIVEEYPKTSADIVVLKAYLLQHDEHAAAVAGSLKNYMISLHALDGTEQLNAEISVNSIPDEDWNKKWKSFFQPVKVTDRLVIKPSWQNYWKKEGEIIVELDPGMAFGTGTHPSTRMCLRAIDELAGTFNKKDTASLLDVGTGSGILAISGKLFGFKHVVGIDFDHVAVKCAAKNASNNNVSACILFSTDPLKKIEGTFDVVVANILPHVLIKMKAELIAHLSDNGFLILSGILNEKAGEVIAEFSQELAFVKQLNEEEWACPVFQKIS